ncbi:MAG: type II secretion system minor pseudopilin GspI [Gammaproteobacteria bacterium]|nr:type II secretion system minor pseudopilin GspI [Gammaproteobacteria bacterium]
MMRARHPIVRSTGFTLLEVLVALAVLALALAAAVSAAAAYVGNQAYLQERTLAHWVARNVLIELQLEQPWPGTGERSDTVRMADLDWTWQATIDETPEKDMRRVTLKVWLGEDDKREPLAGIDGFLEKHE